MVGRVTSDILSESTTEQFAARFFHSSSQTIGLSKNFVRYGYRCFHTKSITELTPSINQCRKSICILAAPHHRQRLQNYLYIQQQRPVLDVVQIHPHHL